MIAVNTSAARMTPSGSAIIDSLSSVDLTRRLTFTFSRIGVMTVGPVTETIAPNRKLSSQFHPKRK
jgi:hypothetical protein